MDRPNTQNLQAKISLVGLMLLVAVFWGSFLSSASAEGYTGHFYYDWEDGTVHCFCQSTNQNCGPSLLGGCENWPE